jgi:hypothetical protein
LVTEDALAQLTGSTDPATTMGEREVVEDEQLTGLQSNLDLNLLDLEAVVLEEREFGAQAVELHTAERVWVNLDTREKR